MQESTNEKNLIAKSENEGLFKKIRNFFKNLFSKKIEIKTKPEINQPIEKTEFKESIKISDVEADYELLELQRKLRAGEVKIEDLTIEQEDQLIDLYDKQIYIKKAKIEELKNKIEKIKKSA